MLNINRTVDGNAATFELEGRLDTVTAPELETELRGVLPSLTELTLDFTKLDYVSSAGLRVLLSAQKVMNRQGTMTIKHAGEAIMEIFDVTGFADILTII